MEYMSANEIANKWGISQRRVAVLCSEGRIEKARIMGNMWLIPANAKKPIDARSLRYKGKENNLAKPFLKWVGGKTQLLKEIESYYPFLDGYHAYFSDLDGYYWEVAWGSNFKFDENGLLKF